MIVLRTPKGWTGPKTVDGKRTEGNWRSHQVPLDGLRKNPEHLAQLEQWMQSRTGRRSYSTRARPARRRVARAAAARTRGASATRRHANGGKRAAETARDARLAAIMPSTSAGRARPSGRGDADARQVLARRHASERRAKRTSASWGRTRRPRTGSTISSTVDRPAVDRRERSSDDDDYLSPTAASWRSSASIRARAGSRATC